MKPTTVGFYLFFYLIVYFSIISVIVALLIRLGVYSIYFFKLGKFYFDWNDVISSIRDGMAAGISIGIASWILSKIEDNKRNKK